MLALLGGGCFLFVGGAAVLIDGRVLLGAALLGAGALLLLGSQGWGRRSLSRE